MQGNVLGLVQSRHHVAEHGPEGWVVSAETGGDQYYDPKNIFAKTIHHFSFIP
jgi:hypothetical protein